MEVSTAGLRKRTHELYPAPAFLEMCVEVGAPVALSSDAHTPADVGADYDQALELLDRVGIGELCVFEHRTRRLEPIGAGAGAQEARAGAQDTRAGAPDVHADERGARADEQGARAGAPESAR